MKFYSEVTAARMREILADVSTVLWIVLWVLVGVRVNDAISQLAGAGRTLQGGGANIQGAGSQLGDLLGAVPLVGAGIDDLTTGAFVAAGAPFVQAGQEMESLVLLVARLLAFLVVAVFVLPWLYKYVPWRAGRIATIGAAERAIRQRHPEIPDPVMQQVLATRAINRLPYQDLLEHTSDPLGDFAAGRYERLAKAELASVGLK